MINNASDCRMVYITCGSLQQARQIGEALVNEKLAACANLIPGVESIYRWQDKIENDSEILLLAKTRASNFAALEKRVLELHSYNCPCIVSYPIAEAHQPYLDWIVANTTPTAN